LANHARRKHEPRRRWVTRKRVWSPEEWILSLRCHRITMVQPAESREGLNLAFSLRANRSRPTCGRVLREAEMCPVLMVVEQIRRHQPFEMSLVHDDHVVQQVASATSHPTLGDTVLPRNNNRPCELAGFPCPSQPKPLRLQTLRRGRIARICVALCRPMFLSIAVQPKGHWDFASH
jgi:hypothetical protein